MQTVLRIHNQHLIHKNQFILPTKCIFDEQTKLVCNDVRSSSSCLTSSAIDVHASKFTETFKVPAKTQTACMHLAVFFIGIIVLGFFVAKHRTAQW